jgi:hypothetical protein
VGAIRAMEDESIFDTGDHCLFWIFRWRRMVQKIEDINLSIF